MKGWHRESGRHSLASRGIKSRAIPNPIADIKWLESYPQGSKKGQRKFKGSGLNINANNVIKYVKKFRDYAITIARNEGIGFDFKIDSIYLVGSRVAGFHKSKSDLDVMVYLKGGRRMTSDEKDDIQGVLAVTKQWLIEKKPIIVPIITSEDGHKIYMDVMWNLTDASFSVFEEDEKLYEPYIKIYDGDK